VHDELTLEMVAPDVRDELLRAYRRDPSWDFREGLGISARLADLLHNDARRILLAFSIELTLIGTPLIMYGDEVGKRNDVAFFDRAVRAHRPQRHALPGARSPRLECDRGRLGRRHNRLRRVSSTACARS
jgi:glycosidase